MSMPDMRQEAVGKAAIILRAARGAFLANGFGAVSMDAIAREAGVSKATIYAHFGSKEELFGAVVADVAEQRFGGFSARELDPLDIEASLGPIAGPLSDLGLSPLGGCGHPGGARSPASSSARCPASRCSARCSGSPDPSATAIRSRDFCGAPPRR